MAGAAPTVKSYSLWLLPKAPLSDKLHAEVRRLAATVPGAPTFLPHVTLLGGVRTTEADMLERAHTLSAQLKPYHISFDRVAYGSIFHQCVYVLCKTEAATMQAGAAARAAYGQDPASRYMPHLSLLYSDMSEEERQHIVGEEQQRLFGGSGEPPLLQGSELGFEVDSLTVWETEESDRSLTSWRQLAEFPLTG